MISETAVSESAEGIFLLGVVEVMLACDEFRF